MDETMKEAIRGSVEGFRLPRYHEIPDVGLYLEQTTKYITDCLAPLGEGGVTGSMVSNYVKRGLVANPVKKQYDREQIAHLIYVSVVKSVLAMEDIRLMLRIQKRTYTSQIAYDYFCDELENVLAYVFGIKPALDTIGRRHSDEKVMLRNTIITVAHKIYLDKLFEKLHALEPEEPKKK